MAYLRLSNLLTTGLKQRRDAAERTIEIINSIYQSIPPIGEMIVAIIAPNENKIDTISLVKASIIKAMTNIDSQIIHMYASIIYFPP